jgi:chaperone required for assembly of F1-ATPase
MSGWVKKRFWTEAAVAPAEGGWTVRLDDRPLKTPAKAPLVVPSRALADMIAAEWAAQDGAIRPETMPATRAANAAIDKVRGQHAEVAQIVAAYGDTDLLCYRAQHPAALVDRQAQVWDPLLAWAEGRFGVRFHRVPGVMPRPQPPETLARLTAEVRALDPFRLTAFHDLVSLPGSLVIGLAAAESAFATDALWQAARLDDLWQAQHWGADDEAEAHAALRQAAFFQAERLFRAMDGSKAPDSWA